MKQFLMTCLIAFSTVTYVEQLSAEETSDSFYALLIGVRNYNPDQLVKLGSAEQDVSKLADLLIRNGFSPDRVRLVCNGAGASDPALLPSYRNIRNELARLSDSVTSEDSLIIAFSGHGLQDTTGKYFFCPFDADLNDAESLIPIEEIYDAIALCSSKQKLLIIDAMHDKPFADGLENETSTKWRSVMPELPPPPIDTAVFVSCNVKQVAPRNNELSGKPNLFFGAILTAIQGEAAGPDGSITLPDVERYVKKEFDGNPFYRGQSPILQNNTTTLFTIANQSMGADDMEMIQDLIRGDRYDDAFEIVNRRLATNPDDANALAQFSRLISYQAEQFRDLSSMQEAMDAADKAVKIAPNEPLPYIARANCYRISKQYEKAFADATSAVQRDPNCVMAHVIRGFAYHHLHDLEGMAREAKIGMEIEPEHPEARGTYVAYLFAMGKYDEGHSQLDRAIAVTKNMPALYFLKGYGFEKQGKHREAVEQYTLAISINDQIPGYFCRRALSNSNGGNHNAALADIASAERILPTYVDIASARTMVIQNQKGYGHSAQAIADGLKTNPESADLWQGQGFNFYNTRRYSEAVKSFERALEINPGYGEAHMGMGMVCVAQNKLDEALVHLNRATRHKEHLSRAYFEKCLVYIKRRDFAAALKEIDQALKYEPTDATYQLQRQALLPLVHSGS